MKLIFKLVNYFFKKLLKRLSLKRKFLRQFLEFFDEPAHHSIALKILYQTPFGRNSLTLVVWRQITENGPNLSWFRENVWQLELAAAYFSRATNSVSSDWAQFHPKNQPARAWSFCCWNPMLTTRSILMSRSASETAAVPGLSSVPPLPLPPPSAGRLRCHRQTTNRFRCWI